MTGLFDRPPPPRPRGLFEGIFAGMGRGLTNPGGFFVNEGAPAVQALGGMVLSPFVQANKAMPWGGNDPRAIGIDPQTGSIDPNVMVPWATDVAGTVTAGAGLAPAVPGAAGMGIRAYHGSPHDFERFDLGKIGTGEGAQAYGHGLYFAENQNVAKEYQITNREPVFSYNNEKISPSKTPVTNEAVKLLWEHRGDKNAAVNAAQRYEYSNLLIPEIEKLDFDKIARGRMYEVDIDASPDEFLDWDKPLSEQPPKLQEAMKAAGFEEPSPRMADKYRTVGAMIQTAKGPETSAELRAAGIKGIRYKDAGSRNFPSTPATDMAQSYLREAGGDIDKALAAYDEHIATVPARLRDASMDEIRDAISMGGRPVEQTHNYVVFDDKTISILKKYGLAGLTAGGAGAAMLGGGTDQAQAAQPPWMTGGRF